MNDIERIADKRAALKWLAGSLAWEHRLAELRGDRSAAASADATSPRAA